MAPSHKPQNSAGFCGCRMPSGAMAPKARCFWVPWHPHQPPDNAPFTGAAPVRTVHYILNAKGVRHNPRMSLLMRSTMRPRRWAPRRAMAHRWRAHIAASAPPAAIPGQPAHRAIFAHIAGPRRGPRAKPPFPRPQRPAHIAAFYLALTTRPASANIRRHSKTTTQAAKWHRLSRRRCQRSR